MREQGRSKTGIASLPHVKLSLMSAPVPSGERQEYLDAIVSFAGAGQRRHLFQGLDILTIKWATGDLPEECRFLLNTQSIFLKKEKDPTTKQFDDDESFRSFTEAQEVTTDIPEDSVTYDQQEVDSKTVRPIQMEEFLRKYVSRRLFGRSVAELPGRLHVPLGFWTSTPPLLLDGPSRINALCPLNLLKRPESLEVGEGARSKLLPWQGPRLCVAPFRKSHVS